MLHNDNGWMNARALPVHACLSNVQGLTATRQGTLNKYERQYTKYRSSKVIELWEHNWR